MFLLKQLSVWLKLIIAATHFSALVCLAQSPIGSKFQSRLMTYKSHKHIPRFDVALTPRSPTTFECFTGKYLYPVTRASSQGNFVFLKNL